MPLGSDRFHARIEELRGLRLGQAKRGRPRKQTAEDGCASTVTATTGGLASRPAGKDWRRAPYFRTQQCLIVEVLSDATERIDRQEKLLAQDLAEATLYRRSADWTAVQVAAEGILSLDCVGLDLPMTSVYEGVELSRKA